MCDLETFPGADSSTLTIPSVQKSNEGSYRCIVSNCADSEMSECATLTLGELNCMHTVVHSYLKIIIVSLTAELKVRYPMHLPCTSMHSIVFQDRVQI